MNSDNDHSAGTHSAKCDMCDYVAMSHAHDEEAAVTNLSMDLAEHNKLVHSQETNPEEIKVAVKAKMQNLN